MQRTLWMCSCCLFDWFCCFVSIALSTHTLIPKSNDRFFCFRYLKTFQSEECFQFWRQYNWIGVQHFHKIKSDAKWLTQCVPRSKCDTVLLFKIKFILRDLLDSIKFILFLWHLEIKTPTPFLLCFMVIEPAVMNPWPMKSDRPWRLNGSISSR